MSANFTPDMVGYKGLSPFRFWCQKTLPLVYDDSLSYYELLCKVVGYINNLITDVAATEENVDRLLTAYNQLQEYVNDYFDGTDFQQKIDDSLDRYAEDGTLSAMVNTHVRALLPYEVGQQIGDVVDEQLPPVVDLKLGGVVDNKLPDVVDDKLEDVVRPMIVPAVSGLLPQEVGRQLPDEVETQLPGAISEDLGTIAPPVIQQWLNDHPDATTSVEDGSISLVKLNTVLQRLARLDGNFYPAEYDPTVTYNTDDMCTYRNTLTDVERSYKCIATSTTGTFSASDWAVVDENDIVINARAIYDLASSIAPVYRYPNNPAIPNGTIFFYRGNARNSTYGLWRATTDIPAATFVTPSYAERVTILDLIGGIDQLETDVADLKRALTGLEDLLVTPIYGKNFLNPSEVTSDHFINWENGEEAYNASYVCSDFIKVIKGVTYGFSGTKSHFAFYDGGKNYIKKTTANDITELSGGSVTIASGNAPGNYFVSPIDGYIRYSMNASTVPSGRRVFMAIKTAADLVSTSYPAYTDSVYIEPIDRERIVALENEFENTNEEVDKINTQINDLLMVSPNLLNLEKMVSGYLTAQGGIGDNASYLTSDYIPCKANDTIRYQFDYRGTRYDNTEVSRYTTMKFVCAYDSEKQFISGSHQTSVASYQCPANTAFVRISFTKSSFNAGDFANAAIIISDSSNALPFYPYGEIIGFNAKIDAYLPKHIYCAVGRTIEIYNNQVCIQADEYHVRWNCTIGKALARKFSVTGIESQIGTYTLGLTIYNDDSAVLWNASTTLHIVAGLNLQNTYSICPIGDSLTNAKQWMPEVMNLSGDDIAFVGTYSATAKDSDGVSKTFQHEGRSGFSAYNYIAGSPYTFGGATETPHNKFWDGSAFSWSHYKTTYNIDPDAVMVWLGTNGITLDNTANAGYIKDIVDIIRADDPTIPIYVCNTIYRGNQNALGEQTATDGYAPNKGAWNYQEKQKVMNLMQILDGLIDEYQNVYLINLALSHDSEYNYGAVSTPVNPRASQEELMPIEATHPQAQGYFQIADIIYSVLSAKIS